MTKGARPVAGDAASSELAMALFASLHAPGRKEQQYWLSCLQEWVERLGPVHSQAEIAAALTRIQGTELEPFILTGRERDLASLFLRAAFSSCLAVSRVRVVSLETLSNQGGAVITNNLRSYYVERFALGHHRRSPKAGWVVAPGVAGLRAPQIEVTGSSIGHIEASPDGLFVSVPWPSRPSSDELRQLQERSRVFETGTRFSSLGIGVEWQSGSLRIIPGSSEAAMRFLALCSQGALLDLREHDGEAAGTAVALRLRYPDEGRSVALPMFRTVSDQLCGEWLHAPLPKGAPRLSASPEAKRSLLQWAPVPRSWCSELLETLK